MRYNVNNMTKKKIGRIHIYTGEGKGKTTAGLGLAIRAIGHGLKVGIIYFDKGGDFYGERKILKKLVNKKFKYRAFGLRRFQEGKGFRFKNIPGDIAQAKKAVDHVHKWFKQNFDLIILDEINTTTKTGLLKLPDILKLLKKKPADLELVLTGRYAPKALIKLADLVSEIIPVKHYMYKGHAAKKGIEY